MTKVFIGGSRRVTRLNADVQRRIDKIIEQGFPILVGDANGADKAIQDVSPQPALPQGRCLLYRWRLQKQCR